MRYKGILFLIFIFLFTPLEMRLPKGNLSVTAFSRICLAEDWEEFRSLHFIIYYKEASRDFLNKLRNLAEDYYQDILEDLGFRRSKFWTWENRARIYVFDSRQDYIKATRAAPWSAANVDYHNKIINTYPDAPDFFENILVHEMAHIIFREYVGFSSNTPLWLDEGVAIFMEKKREANRIIRKLKTLKKANALFGLKELTAVNSAVNFSQDKASAFYIQSFSLVYFLIEQFGRDNFAEFCYALRQERSLKRSLIFAYDIDSLDDLEMKWQRYFFD